MKLYSYVNSLLIFSILFLLISSFGKANPILIGPSHDDLIYILFLLFCLLPITIFIEFGTILLIINKFMLNPPIYKKVPIRQTPKNNNFGQSYYNKQTNSKLDLFKNVFVVNLVTFPITQLFVLFLMLNFPNLNYLYLTAEIIPISFEIFLFLRIYKRYNILGFLRYSLSLNRRVFSVFSANLVSFGFGIFLSFMQIPLIFN